MSQAQLLPAEHFSPSVFLSNSRPATTSIDIADHFGKQHKDVLKSIRNLYAELPEDVRERNFALTSRTVAGPNNSERQEEFFIIYFDGFILLVMGYTGKKALQIKLLYIAAFNAMRDELAAQREAALPEVPHIKITPSTTASRKPLRALVHAWAQVSGTPHTALWPQVKAHFQLERIDDLPEEWIPDALEWVQGKIDEQRQALPPSPGSNPGQSRPTPAPIWNRAAPALAITDEIDVHLAAIREHIRHINDHEEAIFHAVRKGMPPLSGTGPRSSLALQIRRNMENAGWSLHYALKSMEASARTALAAGRI